MQRKTDPVVLGVVGCFVAFLIGVTAIVAAVFVWLGPRAASSAHGPAATSGAPETPGASAVVAVSTSAPRRPWEPLPAEPCVGAASTTDELTEPLRVHDPSRIDLAELFDQARPLAVRLEPNARLVSISALKEADGGTFDSADGNFSFNFEYRCLRAGAPPGQDLYQGMLLVLIEHTTVRASRVPVAQAPTLAFRGALPEPPCSTVAAWATAVASGVPAQARASFLYGEATGSAGGASWLVTVAGHPFKREINGETCRLRSNSAIHPDLVDPGATLPDLHPAALPASSALPASATAEPASEPAPGAGGDLAWEQSIDAGDMTAVDVGALFSQARVVAEKLQTGAQLTGITAFEMVRGTADLTGEVRVLYKFEHAGQDPSQPPGKDTVERAIDVTAQHGKLRGVRRVWPATQLNRFGGPLKPPACTSRRAWEAATNSGVPDDAVAMLHYYDNTPFEAGGPWVWSVRVSGHDDYRREIDGQTCALVKSWGASPRGAESARAPGSVASAAPVSADSAGGGCTLTANAIPVAEVLVDGRRLGTTPKVGVAMPCGPHTVTFVHPEQGKKTVAVTLNPGQPAKVSVKF